MEIAAPTVTIDDHPSIGEIVSHSSFENPGHELFRRLRVDVAFVTRVET